jgi:hypothetical protein
MKRFAAALLATMILAAPAAAGSLSTAIISLFPKDVAEFAYADLKSARKHAWFAQMKDQILPTRFRQFEQFLVSAGIDPNAQVDELAWAATLPTKEQGDMVVGIALGSFRPTDAETFFKQQKLGSIEVRGFKLFAFGSGAGPTDIFFFFLDSNTAAFGHRAILEKMIEVRFGAEEGLLRNEELYPLIEETNGRSLVWAVLGPGYTQVAIQQLVPEAAQFPEAPKLAAKLKATIIELQPDKGLDAKFQSVCASPDDANLFAALIQAGLMYKRYQEAEANPDLAKVLETATVAPRGDRLEMRVTLSEETLLALLRRNTFAVKL